MARYRPWGVAWLVLGFAPVWAQTATDLDALERRLRNQQQQEELQRQREQPLIRIDPGVPRPPGEGAAPTPDADTGACATVDRFELLVPPMYSEKLREQAASALPQDRFFFLRELLPNGSACHTQAHIAQLVARLTAELLQRGYTTTRVVVPAQSTADGVFVLWLLPGTVGRIELRPAPVPRTQSREVVFQARTLSNVLSLQEGDIFNIRPVEQAIESLRQAQSQDMDFALEPGEELGVSHIIVTVKQGRPWRLLTSINNHGSQATGRYQGSLSLTVDNFLGLSDVLSFNQGADIGRDGGRYGTASRSVSYGLTWRDWHFQTSLSDSSYYQRVAGIYQTFISSGDSTGAELKVAYDLYRGYGGQVGSSSRASLFAKRGRRIARSFIDDAEIGVQHRDVGPLELGLTYRKQTQDLQFDFSWSRVKNLRSDNPYWYNQTSASLVAPFQWSWLRGRYSGSLFAQSSKYPLKGAQWLSVGGPFSVRGFDGEVPLAAEQGVYLRNEVEFALGTESLKLYLGVDGGRVYGPQSKQLLGDRLSGKFFGVRGLLGSTQCDLQVGYPIGQPDGFPKRTPAVFFSLSTAH